MGGSGEGLREATSRYDARAPVAVGSVGAGFIVVGVVERLVGAWGRVRMLCCGLTGLSGLCGLCGLRGRSVRDGWLENLVCGRLRDVGTVVFVLWGVVVG